MSDLELGVSGNCRFLAGAARDAKIVSCYPPPYAIVGVINYDMRLSRTWETVI